MYCCMRYLFTMDNLTTGTGSGSSGIDCPELSLLSNIDSNLFAEIKNMCKEQGKLSDQALLALYSVFGATLERALELLEKNCVTYLRIPKRTRYVVQVSGSSGALYTLFPGVNYCPCPAYRYHVIGTRTDLTCKHVIAARLAEILGQGKEIEVSDRELTRILLQSAGLSET